MTTLVTGATGHIGQSLVRALLQRGRRVRALVYDEASCLDGLQVERAPGDIRDPSAVRAACDGADVVYHLAGRISIDGDHGGLVDAVNRRGTVHVLEACRDAGVKRLVHFSSIHALEPEPLDGVVTEARPPALGLRAGAYDRSKALAEQAVAMAVNRGLDAVIVNPVAVLGPLDFAPSLTGQALLQLANGTLPGLIDAGFSWVDARDVARGALAAEEHGRTGERYILTGEWASVVELARHVERVTGSRPPRFISPVWLARATAPLMLLWARATGQTPVYTPESVHTLRCYRYIDGGKAERELGFHARPLSETVCDTIRWLIDHRAEIQR